MTMFKTREQIEEMAKKIWRDNCKKWELCEGNYHIGTKQHSFVQEVSRLVTRVQQDIKEACSEGFEKCFKNGRNGNGETPSQIEVWQACALFHKAKIDTLKQRELGYQSDLRQKDAEIDRLKKKISSFDAYASADEKYQEAVKDIEYLTFKIKGHLTLDSLEKLNDKIRTKYGLDKKEG